MPRFIDTHALGIAAKDTLKVVSCMALAVVYMGVTEGALWYATALLAMFLPVPWPGAIFLIVTVINIMAVYTFALSYTFAPKKRND